MKKLDKLVLNAFLGPFSMTFLVVVFILLTQHMLKYFDDIIGKGLGWDVIGQLLFYFAIFMTPVALPLAVLLSALIAFGNLGEHFELTAIKSAGVSLVRTLQPIFFFVLLLTGVAFYANNNLVPKAALEAYSLLYDIKQKKPALDLREGAFYSGINDISIKVNKKFPDGKSLKGVIVYDHRKNDGNKEVTIADSGRMYTILNERYLKFELYNGYRYSEDANSTAPSSPRSRPASVSLSRTKFAKTQVVFDLSSFNLERTDKKWFQGNRIMRNLVELNHDMDSMRKEVLSQKLMHYQYKPTYFIYYHRGDSLVMPPEVQKYKIYRDSITALSYKDKTQTQGYQSDGAATKIKPHVQARELQAAASGNALHKKKVISDSVPVSLIETDTIAEKKKLKQRLDSIFVAQTDSLFKLPPTREMYQAAANSARQVKSQVSNANTSIDNYTKEYTTFRIQWHKILASSMACIAMFLIGAPLGAIIKKGGLGMPFIVSILFFIIYYVVTMQGEKLAKQGTISAPVGVWMADFLLLLAGLFFLRQARIDARLFEADFYSVVFDKVKKWIQARRAKKMVTASS
jgi:lipopolysaccharide export system permease protein